MEDGMAQLCIITTVLRSGYISKWKPYALARWCSMISTAWIASKFQLEMLSNGKGILLFIYTNNKCQNIRLVSWFKINRFCSLLCHITQTEKWVSGHSSVLFFFYLDTGLAVNLYAFAQVRGHNSPTTAHFLHSIPHWPYYHFSTILESHMKTYRGP